MIYFGAQNDPEIGPRRPIFNTPLKVSQIDKYTKIDAKLVKTFRENDHLFWSPKWPRNLAFRTICSTYICSKWLAINIWSNTDVKPVKIFEKVTKHQTCTLTHLGPPDSPNIWASCPPTKVHPMSSSTQLVSFVVDISQHSSKKYISFVEMKHITTVIRYTNILSDIRDTSLAWDMCSRIANNERIGIQSKKTWGIIFVQQIVDSATNWQIPVYRSINCA